MKKPFARPLLAAVLAGIIVGAPVAPVSAQQNNPPPKPPPQTSGPVPPAQGSVPISLGTAKYDYTHGAKAFPTLLEPYKQHDVAPGELINSPRLGQLIHDGKLSIT